MSASLAMPSQELCCLHWRLLAPADLEAMWQLHLLSMDGLLPEVVKTENLAFFTNLLQGQGQVISAWAQDELIAYGVLQHELEPEDQLPEALRLTGRPLIKLAGAAVAPAWRGQGLQRQLIERRLAIAPPQAQLYATASPLNAPSWSNLLRQRFHIRALVLRYGGLARYLMLQSPLEQPCPPGPSIELPATDFALQQRYLQQNWAGIAPAAQPSHICYAPTRQVAP